MTKHSTYRLDVVRNEVISDRVRLLYEAALLIAYKMNAVTE